MTNDGALTLIGAHPDARALFRTDPVRRRHGCGPALAAAVAGVMGLAVRWRFRRQAEFVPLPPAGEADAVRYGSAITAAREQIPTLQARCGLRRGRALPARRGRAQPVFTNVRGSNRCTTAPSPTQSS